TEQKPSYILKSDYNFGVNFGLPARNKGKVVTSASYVRILNDYYQTQDFLQIDTADQSIMTGPVAGITFERNTLNRKQYPNQGTFLSVRFRYVNIHESTIPGSTSVDRTKKSDNHEWVQLR